MKGFPSARVLVPLVLLMLVGLLAGTACVLVSQGPTGPAGPAGPQGSVGAAGPAGPAAKQPAASIALEKLTYKIGEAVVTAGSGFAKDEAVTLMILRTEGPYILVGGAADAFGAFSFKTAADRLVPIAPGAYTVQALGSAGSVATAPIVVTK